MVNVFHISTHTHTFWMDLFEIAVIVINASLLTASAAFPNNKDILLPKHNTVINQEVNFEIIILLNISSALKICNFPGIPFIILLLWNPITGHLLHLVLLSF